MIGPKKPVQAKDNGISSRTRIASGRFRVVPWPRWVSLAIVYFALLTGLGIVGGYSLNDASAANWVGPTANPPLGNIPLPVWNRLDTTQKQEDSAVDVDGYIAVGSPLLDLGSILGGQNVIYGLAAYDDMYKESLDVLPKGRSDYLLLLETVKNNVYTNRFRVDREGNVTATGTVWSAGCLGPVLTGVTGDSYKGDLSNSYGPSAANGYFAANDKCGSLGGELAGSHICSTAEIMESIRCNAPGIKSNVYDGLSVWIQDGPPGYVAPSNDCQGWRSAVGTDFGRIWQLNANRGGVGFLSTCNQEIQFACCK